MKVENGKITECTEAELMAEEIIRVMNGEYRYDACPAGHFCHNMELAARDIGCDWGSSPPCKQILTAWLLYCANCGKYNSGECRDWNRDNYCWALILDWLTREVRE